MLKDILCVFVLAFSWIDVISSNRSLIIDMTDDCPDTLYRLDDLDEVWVTLNGSKMAWRGAQTERCQLTFETTPDQGICIDLQQLDISTSRVRLDFKTTPYKPDKRYSRRHGYPGKWCTHRNLLAAEMVVDLRSESSDVNSVGFVFQVRNKTLDQIHRIYHLDSLLDCNMEFSLRPEEAAIIRSHTVPAFDVPPEVCAMTFTSDSEEEYGQVCVSVERFSPQHACDMELVVSHLDTAYWDEQVKYDCDTKQEDTVEVCSRGKRLTLRLTRGNHTHSGADFNLKIASKRMPFWESSETKKSELRTLAAVKSLTYLIATLDTAIALTAAFISIAASYPYGKLKIIGDIFGKDPTVPTHYANDYAVPVAVTSSESGQAPC